jgi:hypothetical protein
VIGRWCFFEVVLVVVGTVVESKITNGRGAGGQNICAKQLELSSSSANKINHANKRKPLLQQGNLFMNQSLPKITTLIYAACYINVLLY